MTPMAVVEERAKKKIKEAIKEKIPHLSEKTIKAQKDIGTLLQPKRLS